MPISSAKFVWWGEFSENYAQFVFYEMDSKYVISFWTSFALLSTSCLKHMFVICEIGQWMGEKNEEFKHWFDTLKPSCHIIL